MKPMTAKITLLIACLAIAACSPEVGSKAWCEKMEKKAKGEWTANEATDFAKHCLLRQLGTP